MRKIGFIICFCFWFQIQAQENTVFLSDDGQLEIKEFPSWPNCENTIHDRNTFEACLKNSLMQRMMAFDFDSEFSSIRHFNAFKAEAHISFILDSKGRMSHISYEDALSLSDKMLAKFVKKELEKYAQSLPAFKPAVSHDGRNLNIAFKLPVRFEFSSEFDSVLEYEWMLLYTLPGEKERYEIWFHGESAKFLVLETSKEDYEYLGSFNSLNEILKLQPYKDIVQKMDNRMLITESGEGKDAIRIYSFLDHPEDIHLYKLNKKGQEKLYKKTTRTEMLGRDFFLALILR